MEKIKLYEEDAKSNFEGTIIDLETIGNFQNTYFDSRRYANIKITTFGFITKDWLKIHYTPNPEGMGDLNKEILSTIISLPKPFFAFNAAFEMSVLFHNLGKKIGFKELNRFTFEKKKSVVEHLGIQNYDDPFDDDGKQCITTWENGDVHKVVAHNRADLLKQKDILLKRGFREPDKIKFKE